MVDNNKK